jgi:hypothetical protein
VTSVVIALVIGAIVVVAALVIRQKRVVDVPTQKVFSAPTQIDRTDFPGVQQEWMIAVFTSATCHACSDMLAKAQVMASKSVAVVEIEYSDQRALHLKYNIEAVPTVVVSDIRGVVHKSFLGPVSATDLWAGIASVRDPQLQTATDGHCQNHDHN